MKAQKYFDILHSGLKNMLITDAKNNYVKMEEAFKEVCMAISHPMENGQRIFFIGNGGSSSIASHMAIDYTKNGKLRSLAFNDVAAITCLGNDYGYEHIFSKQIEYQAKEGDILFAISSSGKSRNILYACDEAINKGCVVYTLSGFDAENPLRKHGDLNFYVPAKEYGFVEVAHTAILHCILDMHMGIKI